MKKLPILLLFLSVSAIAFGNLHRVGPTRIYTSPNALYLASVISSGDTIEIDAGDYIGTASLVNWSANNLVIRGISGRPHMIANGQNIGGKSIWITSGNDITIENIEFSGCSVPDQNGAGIRAEGLGLTIRSCYFHDNENGILTNNNNAGDLLIEYTEFNRNGFGDGLTHNVYVGHISKLIFRYNYSHHANVGHNLKSRANENIILYNRIMDETTGNSSRLIDLPNGGFSLIMGNLLMQGNNAPNNNMVGYGLEGLLNPVSELYFVNNSMVNKRVASCRFLQIQAGTSVAQVYNNIFAGTGTVITGSTTAMSNNLVEVNINSVLFTNEANYDYGINAGSAAIDGGIALGMVNSYSLVPDKSYQHPLFFSTRIPNGQIDIGAYEYNSSVLPIRMTEFNIKKMGTSVLLTWKTEQEINSRIFDIQSSPDGLHFKTIGAVAASGNSSQQISYQFTDCCPGNGYLYYRIKNIDQDEQFSYSVIRRIFLSATADFSVYPNPVGNGMLTIELPSSLDKPAILKLFSASGILLSQKNLPINETKISFEMGSFPAGAYTISIDAAGFANKLIIKN